MNKNLKVKIKLKSVFLFVDILKKMDIDLNDLHMLGDNKEEKLGKQLVKILIDGLDKAELEVYLFLSNILNVSETEIEEIDVFDELLPALKSYTGWQSFMGKLGQLSKSTT